MKLGHPNRVLVSAVVLLAACGEGSNESANQVVPFENSSEIAPPKQHAIRALSMEEQRAIAFQAAFGDEQSPVVDVEGERLRYSPGRLVWIGERAVLLSPGENLDKCHACAGALAVHYLEPASDGFRVTGSWPALVQGSGYGEPPSDWSLSDRFAEYPVLVEEGGYTAQGCTSGGVTLTELRPERPVQSGPVRTLYSNQGSFGADNGAEIDGEIVNIQNGVSFDVTYSGSRTFTETWVRRGDTWQLRGGETRMPIC